MKPTKERIIEAAIDLYNQRGVNNITLRDIAQEVGISPGNLAYHFKNQDFIIEEAFRLMEQEREEILMGVQQIPSFENINRQIQPLLDIAYRYRFFHLDAAHIIRTYPAIAEWQRAYFDNSIRYVRAVIDLSVGMGNCQPESRPGEYARMAQQVWMIMNFWVNQLILRGLTELDAEVVRQHIWDLVLPRLTEQGRHHFKTIYRDTHAPSSHQD